MGVKIMSNEGLMGNGLGHKLFSYGTLADSIVQEKLFGRVVDMEDYVLDGYMDVMTSDGYKTLIESDGSSVEGKVLFLTGNEISLCDNWEEIPVYDRDLLDDVWVYFRKDVFEIIDPADGVAGSLLVDVLDAFVSELKTEIDPVDLFIVVPCERVSDVDLFSSNSVEWTFATEIEHLMKGEFSDIRVIPANPAYIFGVRSSLYVIMWGDVQLLLISAPACRVVADELSHWLDFGDSVVKVVGDVGLTICGESEIIMFGGNDVGFEGVDPFSKRIWGEVSRVSARCVESMRKLAIGWEPQNVIKGWKGIY
jgi:hypothetical protein